MSETQNIITPITFNTIDPEPYTWVEEFRRISDYVPGVEPRYFISNHGRLYDEVMDNMKVYVYDYRDGKDNSYQRIQIRVFDPEANRYKYKYFTVHRLVLSCFRPEQGPIDQKMDCNHKDGVKTNNYVHPFLDQYSNLEWVSHSDNAKHAFQTGLNTQVGEMNSSSKITEETAKKIIILLEEGKYTVKQIVQIVGSNATESIVSAIKNGATWTHLTDGIPIKYIPTSKRIIFTVNDIRNFCSYLEKHKDDPNQTTIQQKCIDCLTYYGYECNYNTMNFIRHLYKRDNHTDISFAYDF